MALYYTLPLYRDVYALLLMLFRLTHEFAREYNYTLGQDIKHDTMQLLRHIYRANQGSGRAEHLARFADDFAIVKLQIRLCHDLRLISSTHDADVIVLMDSIGKQVNGWRKGSKDNNTGTR